MLINRSVEPVLKVPSSVNFQEPEEFVLDNKLKVHLINAGEKDVIKFEIIFPSGINNNDDYTLAMACHQLLETGTRKLTASQIAEKFDFHGSYFNLESGPDFKSIALYSLNNQFNEAFPLLIELLTEAVFPESELENYINRKKQTLAVNKEKVSWITRKTFNATLFCENEPYGFTPDENHYNNLKVNKLLRYYNIQYQLTGALIIVSGKITESNKSAINNILGKLKTGKNNSELNYTFQSINPPSNISIPRSGALQCGIRIGKILFTKSHPDFIPMQIVNTILGGYFGSRLMSNIREDKGYTYGIGSGLHSYLNRGVFFISTEVGNQVSDNALAEIMKELQRLIDEPVPEKELSLVKNYLAGVFLRNFDGPFSVADQFKSTRLHDLKYDYFKNYLYYLNNLSTFRVTELASKYLQPDSMTIVKVG